MFKKLLSSALCLSMLLSTAIPAFATDLTEATSGQTIVTYGMSESFTVVIPGNFTIGNDGSANANVSAENVMLGANKSLAVTISGDDYVDKWELIDQAEASNKLTYTIGSTEGAADIVNDSIVLLVGAGEAYNSIVTETLYFTITDTLTKSGTYDDTLTFTVYVDGTNVLEGSGQTFHRLAPSALSFRSHEPLNEFQKVLINGETLDESNYTLTEGSTIVTLDIDYLQSLPTDTYTVEIVSENKSPSGSFRVVEPVTNSHGFYYNQPYAAYIEPYGVNAAFLIRENGTVDIAVYEDASINIVSGVFELIDDTFVIAQDNLGALTFEITEDKNKIHNVDFNIDFVLDKENIVADDDYVYAYSSSLKGYVATVINSNKSNYGVLKYNINGKPLMRIANNMFAYNTNLSNIPDFPDAWMISNNTGYTWGEGLFEGCTGLTSVVIPEFFSALPYGLFENCVNLEKVVIPKSITAAGHFVFKNCTSLTEIRFEGTADELMAINEFKNHEDCGTFENVPATQIICSDKIINIK